MGDTIEKVDDLLHEKEVMEKWGKLFAERELAEARKAGTIQFFDLRKGPHYTPQQLIDYLKTKLKGGAECHGLLNPDKEAPAESGPKNGSSKSETFGSPESHGRRASNIVGMTPELEERAARALEYET